jgi:hypothetical protein
MAGNMEGNDSPRPEDKAGSSPDFTRGFTIEDQREVVKMAKSQSVDAVTGLLLDNSERERASDKFPHSWYLGNPKNYGLPGDAAVASIEQTLKGVWRNRHEA